MRKRSQLRKLRTELALLECIGRKLKERPIRHRSAMSANHQAMFSPGDRWELERIVWDANHPAVPGMVAIIDEEFSAIRKEIMMSVVNEEAEKIAQDVVDSKVDDSVVEVPTQPKPAPENVVVDSATEALAVAEAELAVALGQSTHPNRNDADRSGSVVDVQSENTPTDPQVPPTIPETPRPSTVAVDPPNAPNAETTSAEATASQAKPVASEPKTEGTKDTPANETGNTPSSSMDSVVDVGVKSEDEVATEEDFAVATRDIDVTLNETPQEAAAVVQSEPDEVVATVPSQVACHPSDVNPSNEIHSPERAEQAVTEIEKGIRKISGILSGEIQAQWDRAKQACEDITGTQKSLDEAGRKAEELLEEIAQFKDEMKSARDEMESVMREARQYREETKQAQRRADASAEAAEKSADQAAQEAQLTANSR